ncbi:hypothetical protein CEXT_185402 [Caerostris extrusa]|nr:hypothetical protein CEXT_185402 [Caerostris extrusa]
MPTSVPVCHYLGPERIVEPVRAKFNKNIHLEAIPEMTCDNPKCNQSFHHACLYEYIRMLPDVRSSFNKLFGECPYCCKPLWCTVL